MATPSTLPDLKLLRDRFTYSEGTLLYKSGKVAGTSKPNAGYYKVFIDGKYYPLHRVIYYLVSGDNPGNRVVDHIDRNKLNNKIENLRCVSHSDNQHNRSEPKGYKKHGNRYQACLRVNGVLHSLGCFDTPEEAHQKYLSTKNLPCPPL
jgi:hypothetical protein